MGTGERFYTLSEKKIRDFQLIPEAIVKNHQAKVLAGKVIDRHTVQHYKGIKNVIPVVSEFGEIADLVEVYTIPQAGYYPYPTLSEEGDWADTPLPIFIIDRLYKITDRDGRVSLFIDHTNSLQPTDELYQTIKEHNLNPLGVLANVFLRQGNIEGGDELDQLLKEHHDTASSNGLDFDLKRLQKDLLQAAQSGYGQPMHCYLASFGGPHTDPVVTDMVVDEALRVMMHQTDGWHENDEWKELFVRNQLSTPVGVRAASLYDVLPVKTDAYCGLGDFQDKIVQSASAQILGKDPPDPLFVLPPLTRDEIAAMVAQRACMVGGNIGEGEFLFPYSPSDDYNTYVLRGLASDSHRFGLDSLEEMEAVVGQALKEVDGITRIIQEHRVVETLTKPHEPVTAVSSDAAEWLDLNGVRRMLESVIPEWKRKDGTRPADLLGQSKQTQTYRLLSVQESMPRVTTVPIQISQGYYQTSKRDVPFWSLFDYQGDPSSLEPEVFIDTVQQVKLAMQTPFWQRQIDPSLQPQVLVFLDWLAYNTEQYERGYGRSRFPDELKRIKYIMQRDRSDSPYTYAVQAMRRWAENTWFAQQIQTLFEQISHLGYPVGYPDGTSADSPYISVGKTHAPFHLLADQAVQYYSNRTLLPIYLQYVEGDEVTSNFEHVGNRLHYVLHPPQDSITCWDPYKNKSLDLEYWEFSSRSKTVVHEWFTEKEKVLPAIEEKKPSYSAHKELNQWGDDFTHWVKKRILEDTIRFEKTKSLKRKAYYIRRAEEAAYALYEVYNIRDFENLRFSSGEGYHFDHVLRTTDLLRQMRDSFEGRIIAPGEIVIQPGEAVFLLGRHRSGKSATLRGLGYMALLESQGVPQPGEVDTPSSLFVDSPIGQERQRADKSLLSSMIPGLNRIALGEKPTLWLLDELGRRTSKRYGEAFVLASAIMANKKRTGNNYFASATHYHDIPGFSPILSALGISPTFYVMEGFQLRPYVKGEQTTSDAYSVMRRNLLGPWLVHFPHIDAEEQQAAAVSKSPSRQSITLERIAAQSRSDIYGDHKDRVSAMGSILPDVDREVIHSYFELFSDLENGRQVQDLILRCQQEGLMEKITILKQLDMLLDTIVSYRGRGLEYLDAVRNTYWELCGVKEKDSVKVADAKVEEGVKALSSNYYETIDALQTIIDENGFDKIQLGNLKITLDRHEVIGIDGATLERVQHEIHKLLALLIYARTVSGENGYTRVAFTDEPSVDIKGLWNPLLNEGRDNQTGNDFSANFEDKSAGIFVSGENYSGKSNYLRAIGNAIWLAQSTGFAPASSLSIHPSKITLLSLTQPVGDRIGKSSMEEEISRRFKPAVLANEQIKDRCLLALFDEPGAPTSAEDAGDAILWLYTLFHINHGTSKLVVASHCDQVPDQLESAQIPVDLVGFKLLTDRPYMAFEGTADSNALEVAKKLGLDETFYKVAKLVYEYIMSFVSGQEASMIAQAYAKKIEEILSETPSSAGSN